MECEVDTSGRGSAVVVYHFWNYLIYFRKYSNPIVENSGGMFPACSCALHRTDIESAAARTPPPPPPSPHLYSFNMAAQGVLDWRVTKRVDAPRPGKAQATRAAPTYAKPVRAPKTGEGHLPEALWASVGYIPAGSEKDPVILKAFQFVRVRVFTAVPRLRCTDHTVWKTHARVALAQTPGQLCHPR